MGGACLEVVRAIGASLQRQLPQTFLNPYLGKVLPTL